MKYYAVTEDPNELLHYGVKGMKWGKHLFGDDLKPKSTAYKNAAKKLKSLASSVTKAVNNTKSTIQKSSVQRSINKQKKQENKFNEAVAKTQRRIDTISNLNNLNKLTSYEKSVERQYKADQKQAKANLKAEKAAIKQEKKYAKNERKMERFMQEAREGRLKYGQLSDEQVQRVTDRLALERSARSLGNTEKASYRLRKKEAIREGKLEGYKRGTAAAMEEVARGLIQMGFKNRENRKALDQKSKLDAERQREANRIRNKKTHKEVREDIKDEAYEAQVREGVGWWNRNNWATTAGAAKELQKVQQSKAERERTQRLQARINDEMDLGNNETYRKFLSEQREQKRIQDVQDRLNSETDEKWNRYLNETGLSDAEARVNSNLFGADQVDKATREEAQVQRAAILAKNEQKQNEEAYNQYVKQQKIQQEHDAEVAKLEKENKQMKEDYQEKLSKYEKDMESDRKAKAKYDQEMAEYNRALSDYNAQMNKYNEDYRVFVRTAQYDNLAVEPTKPVLTAKKPDTPNYINPKKPDEPKYHNIDYTEPTPVLPSYEQYTRQRNIGINSFGNKNNGGGKGKNKGNR